MGLMVSILTVFLGSDLLNRWKPVTILKNNGFRNINFSSFGICLVSELKTVFVFEHKRTALIKIWPLFEVILRLIVREK